MVKLSAYDGEEFWVNPDHVMIVRPLTGDAYKGKAGCRLLFGCSLPIDVQGEAEAVVQLFSEGAE